MIRVRTTDREDGTVLILALIFISVIGVIATALLSFEQTAMRQVRSVRNVNTRETGTNAGIDWAVQSIKSHAAVCFEGGAGYQTLTINAREVKVYCRTTNGSSAGPGGWALYLNGGTLTTKAGGGGPVTKTIVGPVYNSGIWDLGADLQIDGEVVIPDGGACSNSIAPVPDPRLFPLFDNVRRCNVALTEVQSAEPPAPPANNCGGNTVTTCNGAAPAPPADTLYAGSTCRTFSPGNYVDPPVLAQINYFRPGVYSFDWPSSKLWTITSTVRAGDPIPGVEKVETTIPKCAPDPPNTPANPYGAVFVFGRKARVEVRNSGRLEIFSYKNGDLVIPGVLTGPSWANASTVGGGQYLLNIGQGTKPELVVHGGIYAPSANVRLRATNSGIAKFMATTVVADLELDASASISTNNFGVIVPSGNGFKKFKLIAISTPKAGEPPLCTVAALTAFNDAVSTTGIDAWRVDRDPRSSDPATCAP